MSIRYPLGYVENERKVYPQGYARERVSPGGDGEGRHDQETSAGGVSQMISLRIGRQNYRNVWLSARGPQSRGRSGTSRASTTRARP